MKVAIVYDRVNKFGGAERVLLALHEIWPDAPLYTAVYDRKRAAWASIFTVHSSFLQQYPFAKSHHELYPWLTPVAFESFTFDQYDVVISVTSAEAKNILTKPGTVHICYCLTPTRYLWSGYGEYRKNPNIGVPGWVTGGLFPRLVPLLRTWDKIASFRPDTYIAISKTVASRIGTYYKKEVERVIYPPVETKKFNIQKSQSKTEQSKSYFLYVGRLVPYKHVDLVVDACNELGVPLVVVGDGVERAPLVKRARKNIRFLPSVTDKELAGLYQNARAFVFAGIEDFGIAAVEAQAAGIPVIAYKEGGLAEIVIHGKTGLLFNEQTVSSLVDTMNQLTQFSYDRAVCQKNAERFSGKIFKAEMKRTVQQVYNTYV